MNSVEDKLVTYVAALRAGAAAAPSAAEHSEYMQRLAAAGAMDSADMGRLFALLSEEERVFGWTHFTGDSGARVVAAFHELRSTAMAARLEGRPVAW